MALNSSLPSRAPIWAGVKLVPPMVMLEAGVALKSAPLPFQ